MGPRSLSTRLLASVSILLIVFFNITIAALDFAFRRVTEQAMHDRLEAQMLALISASEEDSGGLQPATEKTEERLKNPGSVCTARSCAATAIRAGARTPDRHRSRLRRAAAFGSAAVPSAASGRRLAGACPEPQHRVGIRQRRDADFRVQRRRGSRAVLRAAQPFPRPAVRLVRPADAVAARLAGVPACAGCWRRCAGSSARSKRSRPGA